MIAFCDFTTLVVTGYIANEDWSLMLLLAWYLYKYVIRTQGLRFIYFIFSGQENTYFVFFSLWSTWKANPRRNTVPSLMAPHLTTDSPTLLYVDCRIQTRIYSTGLQVWPACNKPPPVLKRDVFTYYISVICYLFYWLNSTHGINLCLTIRYQLRCEMAYLG